ncbi:cell envelope biogenesis protein OmpA [Gilvibacter sp.]|uniref:cell envelope biogenesis protein OmpA n=1 Tax=Gilvibacter sp. TaxID=2729997 RepID=UPI0025BD5A32|nr:cell envelope biogenesis protein OmpA [Gilvibacter sp.]NQX77074.1 cell envelope biogenesis protein OmpA [Gilvibacter sp.]
MVEQKDKLNLLRDILLIDDREVADAISQRLDTITKTLESKEKLAKKVDPILEEHMEQFVEEIPTRLGPVITKTLKEQIANSKDQVVEALYPIMGKMVKRYIQNELALLSENINNKVNNTFTLKGIQRKLKALFTGVKESDIILSELDAPELMEVFVIKKGSGMLLGNYSNQQTLDKDLISGMLTAIKSFVEDAFQGESQNLEGIDYELYKIQIQNFHSYYMAVVVSGNLTPQFENEIEDLILENSDTLSELLTNAQRENVDIFLASMFEDYLDNT